jgi:hypothetical protein
VVGGYKRSPLFWLFGLLRSEVRRHVQRPEVQMSKNEAIVSPRFVIVTFGSYQLSAMGERFAGASAKGTRQRSSAQENENGQQSNGRLVRC